LNSTSARRALRGTLATLWLTCALPTALAQADEIQVYDGGLAEPGIFNLTWHNNYTFKGTTVPEFPGAGVAEHTLNGVTEWAYGVNKWWEVGLYLPLYSVRDGNIVADGFKLRTLFATPDAGKRRFFYGLGIELSYNARRWETTRISSEFRPIVGWHLGKLDVIFNPILDTAYDGFGRLVFAPSTRIAYNTSRQWAFALEEYADFGPLNDLAKGNQQSHQLFGVVDYTGKQLEVEAGLGFGLTTSADALAFKLILSALQRGPGASRT
jgi:hypothetical protein